MHFVIHPFLYIHYMTKHFFGNPKKATLQSKNQNKKEALGAIGTKFLARQTPLD